MTSGIGPILLVIGVLWLSFSLSDFSFRYSRSWILKLTAGGLAFLAVSLPVMIYFNFFMGSTEVLADRSYTVYAEAVQSGMPFMAGILFLIPPLAYFLKMKYGQIRVRVPHIRIRRD